MKMSVIKSMLILCLSFLDSSSSARIKSKQVLTDVKNGALNGEVVIACSECQKIVSEFVDNCVDEEANGSQISTLHAFCEAKRSLNGEAADFCSILKQKLTNETGESSVDMVDASKPPVLCVKFKNECDKFGGPPNCYSGFCEKVAECVDCPTAPVFRNGVLEVAVCGNAGICRSGWRNEETKGGNGYCECNKGMRGLACNKFV